MNRPNHPTPPEWPLKFLRLIIRDQYLEEIEGDMEEVFRDHLEQYAVSKARRLYAWESLKLLRPSLIKSPKISFHSNSPDMFANYLKIAWRTLNKSRMYSAIKIGGFAIGIAAALLIALYVINESDYDRFYANTDRIYRLINSYSKPDDPEKWTAFQPQMVHVLKDEFPDIEDAGRLIPYAGWFDAGDNQFRRADQQQNNYEEGFAYADQALLDILEVPMIYGERSKALSEVHSIVLSQKMADKYFPDENPVGKVVILEERTNEPFTVGGVMADFPPNSHLRFDFFITLTGVEFWDGEQTSWCCSNYDTYVLLRPGVDPRALEPKLLTIRDNYLVKHFKEQGDPSADENAKYLTYELQPVADIHLKSKHFGDVIPHNDLGVVRLFGAIAVFILLLACINFINLSTAKSANRAKETGLRKVVGSQRSGLIRQFLTESVLYSGISVVLGALLAWAALPYFNALSGKTLQLPWQVWWFVPLMAGVALSIGMLAGIYPSFYLSAFKPIEVLKGNISRGTKGAGLRSAMVVFQFTTSMVLIVCAFIVYNQMKYILNKDLGFDKEQVLLLQGTSTLGDKWLSFKSELLRLPGVKNATASSYLPVEGTKRDQNGFWREGRKTIDQDVGAQIWWTDEDYLATLDMHLAEGRGFSLDMATDTAAIIINETFAKRLGLEHPIGERIENWRTWTVIGVVKDFNFNSMKGGIGALGFVLGKGGSFVAARLEPQNMPETISAINAVWDDFMPNQPIRYTFLDESFANMYKDVVRTGNIFTACAVLAIIIACLGLFGLSTFMAEQRSKEVSIRKVLGASVGSLYQLLTFNFLKLVLISLVIGTPIAWYLMRKWLADYEYRVGITWWFFAAAGMMVIGIALFTVSRQALKTAFSNPADHLRGD
ncbi:MAG: ABC transporter permease [Lewinella sp.]|nr:ABC transporter permease [Lewinella sp.]